MKVGRRRTLSDLHLVESVVQHAQSDLADLLLDETSGDDA